MEINENPIIASEDVVEDTVEEVTGEAVTEIADYSRLFLTTPFEDYTVTEGLLLAILLCIFAAAIVKLLKEGFYWLL